MTVEKLTQKKEEIEEKIKILSQEIDEIVKQIEEKYLEEEEDDDKDKEIMKKNENSNSFIQTFMSIISFVGIIAGVIYVIYTKKGGIG